MNDFEQSFRGFLFSKNLVFSERKSGFLTIFSFPDFDLEIVTVPLLLFSENNFSGEEVAKSILEEKSNSNNKVLKTIFLFEDRWHFAREEVGKRVLAHLGLHKTLFARNCTVNSISAEVAADFLSRNHSYGSAASKYRYGLLDLNRELIAVATFSAPRKMNREGVLLDSYEWVRYASPPDTRVVGGMGKLLNYFIEEVTPQEIMSYSDLEWSEGDVYLKLGFSRAEYKPPISFMVNKLTMERISEQKISRDRKYRTLSKYNEEFIRIFNLGSIKYLLKIV